MKAAKYTNETYAAATLRTSSVFGLAQVMRSGLVDWPRAGQLPEVPQSPGCIGHQDRDTVAARRPNR